MEEISIGSDKKKKHPSASHHQEEINTLRIDKLSNRVTIISVIIPCLIGAILVFAYLDIQEKVFSVDTKKQNEMNKLAQQLEERTNALDVKLAEIQFDLEKKLPEIEKQIKSLDGTLTKLSGTKTDRETFQKKTAKIESMVSNNSKLYKHLLDTVKLTNKETLASLGEVEKKLNNKIDELDIRIHSKLEQIPDYEEKLKQIHETIQTLQERMQSVKILRADIEQTEKAVQQLDTKISALKKRIDRKLEEPETAVPSPDTKETKPSAKQKSETGQISKSQDRDNSQKDLKPSKNEPSQSKVELKKIEPGTIIEENISE